MKTTIKTIVLGAVATFFINTATAQQEAQFTQYLDNMMYYNPAYAGSNDALNVSLLHRQQWAGFKGAPMSTTLGVHSPLPNNLGVGLSVLNDRVGPVNATWINADFSYSLKISNKERLSFGLKGGVNLLNGDISSLYKHDQADDVLNIRYKNQARFNVGAGVYYHSDQFFAGIAIPRIIDNIKDANQLVNPKYISQRHYYFTIGGYIEANRSLKIRPSAMVKMTQNAPVAIDANLAFILSDNLWLGANYRVLESAGIYVQFLVSKQTKIGYAFEFSTSQLRSHNAGTHELMISYNVLSKKRRAATTRHF